MYVYVYVKRVVSIYMGSFLQTNLKKIKNRHQESMTSKKQVFDCFFGPKRSFIIAFRNFSGEMKTSENYVYAYVYCICVFIRHIAATV